MNIQNLSSYDPFADTGDSATPSGKDLDNKSKSQTQQEKYIHIRVQQRNGRKTLTTVQGLPKEYDPKKVLKELKKLFACNGTLVHEEEHGDIIQLQGDQRQKAAAFLVEEMQIAKAEVKVHGF